MVQPSGRLLPRSPSRRCLPPAASMIHSILNYTLPVLSHSLSPNIAKLTFSPSCSLATSLAQRTSHSGSTSGRKPTLVHQAVMTRTWALSRLGPSLPISLSWLVPNLCIYRPESYNPCCRTSTTSGTTSLVERARSRSLSPTDPRRCACQLQSPCANRLTYVPLLFSSINP